MSPQIKRIKTVKSKKASTKESNSAVGLTKSPRKQQTVSAKRKSKVASAQVYGINAKSEGNISLPKDYFGQEPNEKLLAQAVRVYFTNSHLRTASTKTRSEVRGGGAKPWRQKGTGRARAGSRRSPLWVGGGIVFGPRPKGKQLVLPKEMKRKALISALSKQQLSGKIKIISHVERLQPKTKAAAVLLAKLNVSGKTLFVLSLPHPNVKLALKNIPNVSLETVENLNALKVLDCQNLLFSKEALARFK